MPHAYAVWFRGMGREERASKRHSHFQLEPVFGLLRRRTRAVRERAAQGDLGIQLIMPGECRLFPLRLGVRQSLSILVIPPGSKPWAEKV